MINLAADDRTELLRILIPLPMLRNERGREAILESASLQQLLPQLDLSGEPAVAIPLMIKTFATYGRLTYEHEALGRFLSTMRDYVGLEERSILDRIISQYNLMTPPAKSPTADEWTVPVTSKDFLEKIIGENTLRPIAFLQKGINASRSVAYLEISDGVKKWSGTGFLISPNLLMTNHHVLPDKSLHNGTICRFNYQLDVKGNAELYEDYSVSEEGTYYSNLNLDYSIVELKGSPGTKWNYLRAHLKSQNQAAMRRNMV